MLRPYAKDLIERYNSIRKAVGEKSARQIFLAGREAVEGDGQLDPDAKAKILEDYDAAERVLFPRIVFPAK